MTVSVNRLLSQNRVYTEYCILKSPKINASMTPDDIVVVTTGLIDAVRYRRDTDILAFVIAHELAHYKLHHIRNHIALATGISVGLAVANVFVPFVGLADHLINPLATKALSRSQELDADREAIEILRNANWNFPETIGVKALTWLKDTNGEKSTFILWATHPAAADRIENIKKITP